MHQKENKLRANDAIQQLREAIAAHKTNQIYTAKGYQPLFSASVHAQIIIVGQAPGIHAQASGKPWNDASGTTLMSWLGVSEAQFRNENIFAHIPMDFYYPGKGKSGDLPPRKDFAPLWHKELLNLMSDVKLTILIGNYAQAYYLPTNTHRTLTETVRNYHDFLPTYFPIVHPSPLNFRWLTKNPWFKQEVVPALAHKVKQIIAHAPVQTHM